MFKITNKRREKLRVACKAIVAQGVDFKSSSKKLLHKSQSKTEKTPGEGERAVTHGRQSARVA